MNSPDFLLNLERAYDKAQRQYVDRLASFPSLANDSRRSMNKIRRAINREKKRVEREAKQSARKSRLTEVNPSE